MTHCKYVPVRTFWSHKRLIKDAHTKSFPGAAKGVHERREHEGEGLQEGGVHQEGGCQVLILVVPGLRIRMFRSDPNSVIEINSDPVFKICSDPNYYI